MDMFHMSFQLTLLITDIMFTLIGESSNILDKVSPLGSSSEVIKAGQVVI